MTRQEFYAQEKMPIPRSVERENVRFYTLKETGQAVMEITLDLGLGAHSVELAQITDVHLNCWLGEDKNDPEVMNTVKHRLWLAEGEGLYGLDRAMDAAQYADQTILTGDVLDYMTKGSEKLTTEHVFKRDPNVLCCPASHDYSKNVQTGREDALSKETREQMLQSFWPHDIHYASHAVGEKLLCAIVDNTGHYTFDAARRLEADVKRAREEGRYLLVFQHEPISSGKEEDRKVAALWYLSHPCCNFYDKAVICGPDNTAEGDKEFYRVLTDNADVVRGVFCGHYHSAFYNEIAARYTDENGTHPASIPQYTAPACPYNGRRGVLTRIIVR